MENLVKIIKNIVFLAIIGFVFISCPVPEPDPYAPTPGLEFTLINNGTAYSVSMGTAKAAIVVIPAVYDGKPVIEIADSGFSSYTNMTSIIIPDGVTRIGSYAFFHCDNLTSIVIPAGVTNIGNFAFSNCGSLTSVFYGGADSTKYSTITIGSNNTPLESANRYYFSDTNPGTAYTHWRFVNEQPTIWNFIISTQPAEETNLFVGNINDRLIVEASVAEGATLSYQWYSNTTNSNIGGTIIIGANNPEYTMPTTLAVGTYYYFCQVSATNDAGPPIRTNVATVNVSAFPVIIINTQPAATTNLIVGDINETLTLMASVSDGTEVNYQWYSNTTNSNTGGSIIPDATDESFTISTTLTAGTYYYYCLVSTVDEVAIPIRSNVARVNVSVPVITINTQPTQTTNLFAGNISGNLSVEASVTGNAELSYQWYSSTTNSNFDGTAISGATSLSFTIPTTLTAGTYYYFCEVRATNGAVSVRSNVATFNVAVPVITINTQPTPTTNVFAGNISGSLSVKVSVTGNATISYQWYSNTMNNNSGGSIISGATSASYVIPTTLTAGNYYYFCEVSATNGAASVRSNVAVVNVSVPVITINTQPTSTTNVFTGNISGSLSVTASVTGNVTISYQWYSNITNNNSGGSIISGATSASYVIPTTLTAGNYYYFCEVSATNGAASVRSNVAVVNVSVPVITINTQPTSTTNLFAGNISGNLSVGASVTGNATISYQWYSNTINSNTGGSLISGATNSSYIIPTTLSIGTYYYYCQVTAIGGAVLVCSNVARVNIIPPTLPIEMVWVQGGNFELGRELNPEVGGSDVTPVSLVNISGFYMGKYPVTQAQYQAVMGNNPSYFSGYPAEGEIQERCPVEMVSWYDAIVFCNRLSIREGLTIAYRIMGIAESSEPEFWESSSLVIPTNHGAWLIGMIHGSTGYRLPTEAQWEYAAKGGSLSQGYTYSGSNDPNLVAWYWDKTGTPTVSRTHQVGLLAANELGIHDMSGNVWEWCWGEGWGTYTPGTDPTDEFLGYYVVVRGGSWGLGGFYSAESARSVARRSKPANGGSFDNGFRISLP